MVKTQTVKKENRGGARVGAGRKPGGKNRTTMEREEAVAASIDRMRADGGQTGKEALERMLKFAEGCVALLRPTTEREKRSGKEANPDGDWDRFGAWFDRWAYVSKELTKYQSPTFRAIAVAASLPAPQDQGGAIVDGEIIRMPDAEDAERAYLKMIGAAA